MKIIVLAGGLSPERNVSLSSGTKVCRALRARGHEAALVDLWMGTEQSLEELAAAPLELSAISREAPDLEQVKASRQGEGDGQFGPNVLKLCHQADAVFLALHGACGEDGRLQAALDLLEIPYTGSGYLGSAFAMDKDLTKRVVAPLGVRTPKWTVQRVTKDNIQSLMDTVELPCVVKPVDSGSSIGVSIAHSKEELKTALEEAARMGGRTVLEEYIAGREIQVGVLEDKALPSIEIIPKVGFYDYANKYQPGAAEDICPAPVSAQCERELAEATLKVFRALGLSVYARADFIVTEDETPYFLEINTLPGMTPTSLVPQEAAAVGIGYEELCERILLASLAVRGK